MNVRWTIGTVKWNVWTFRERTIVRQPLDMAPCRAKMKKYVRHLRFLSQATNGIDLHSGNLILDYFTTCTLFIHLSLNFEKTWTGHWLLGDTVIYISTCVLHFQPFVSCCPLATARMMEPVFRRSPASVNMVMFHPYVMVSLAIPAKYWSLSNSTYIERCWDF